MRVITLWTGDCLERLQELEDGSVAAFVTDPPYDLTQGSARGFMGNDWDGTGIAFDVKFWELVKTKLMLNGIVKAFGGTRTFHKMGKAIKRAQFSNTRLEAWLYSSGFPHNTNISKHLDRRAGMDRKVVGTKRGVGGENMNDIVNNREVRQTTDEGGKGVGAYGTGAKQVAIDIPVTVAVSEEGIFWEKYGSTLKPSWEPVIVARNPDGRL